MLIKKIGFIGLGEMGYPMALRLCGAGYDIHTAQHSNKKASLNKIENLRNKGAIIEDDFSQVAKIADLIITILPADNEVKEVLLSDGFFNNVKEDAIIMDMTSCSPDTIKEVGNMYSSKGIRIIDAPVSGGVSGAEKGTLSIFASGNEDDVFEIRKVLEVLGTKIFYVGELGKGKAIKSVNQIMVAINTIGFIEAYNLAVKQDLDLDMVYDIIKESSGYSNIFDRKFKKLITEDFDNGFKLKHMRKDIKVALDSSGDTPMLFSNLIHELLLMGKDYDELDYTSISKLFKN